MNLSRKVEKAFSTDYLPRKLALNGLKIHDAHDRKDGLEKPCLLVYAENAQTIEDMPAETGIKSVTLRFKFWIDSDDTDRGKFDTWKEQLEAAMRDRDAYQSALNAPDSGPDRRKVPGLHIHDIVHNEEPSARQQTDWEEDLIFDVLVEPLC